MVSGADYSKLAPQLIRKAIVLAGERPPRSFRIVPVAHHLSHAASAYYFSGFKRTCALTIDGIGEAESTVVWRVDNGEFEKIAALDAVNGSIGVVYELISARLGLGHLAGPGKVMGLAPYGHASQYYERLRRIVRIDQDDSIPYSLSWESGHSNTRSLLTNYRKIHNEYADYVSPPIAWAPRKEIVKDAADLAWAIQRVTEEVVLAIGEYCKRNSSSDSLVLPGGVALNTKSNMELYYSNLFNDVFIFPAAGDAGTPIGAAAYVYEHVIGGKMQNDRIRNLYFGPEYGEDEVKELASSSKWNSEFIGDDVAAVADLVSKGRILGWYQGGSELGPRALGDRSIVADSRKIEMRHEVNQIKGRERWRPLLPRCLRETLVVTS